MRRIIGGILLSATSLTQAAPTDVATDLVAKLSGGKAQIVSTFAAPNIGLTGVVMKRGPSHIIVYVDPAGKYMVSGVVIDANGTNISQQHSEKYIPKPDYNGMLKAAEKTAFVEYGSKAASKVIYVVGESNCGYCKRFHKDIKPFVEKGEVRVRWILMGFDEAADEKAASVLAAANQKDALEYLYEKGVAGKGTPTSLEQVKLNHAFAEAYGVTGTPFILYRTSEGKVITAPGAVMGKELEKLVMAASR